MQLSASPALIAPLAAGFPAPVQPAAGAASAPGDFAQLFASLDSGTSTVAPTLVVNSAGVQLEAPVQVAGAGESQTGVHPAVTGRSILLGFTAEPGAVINSQGCAGPAQPAAGPGRVISAVAVSVESPIEVACGPVSEEGPPARRPGGPELPRAKRLAGREIPAAPESSLPTAAPVVVPPVPAGVPVQAPAAELTATTPNPAAATPDAPESTRVVERETPVRVTPGRAEVEPSPVAGTEWGVQAPTPVRKPSAANLNLPAAVGANDNAPSIPKSPAHRSRVGATRAMAMQQEVVESESAPLQQAPGQGIAVSVVPVAEEAVSPWENEVPPTVAPRSSPVAPPPVAHGPGAADREFSGTSQSSGSPSDQTAPMLVTDSRAVPAAIVSAAREQFSQGAPSVPAVPGKGAAEAVPAMEVPVAIAAPRDTASATVADTVSEYSRPPGLEAARPAAEALAAAVDRVAALSPAPQDSRRATAMSVGKIVAAASLENIAEPVTKSVEPVRAGLAAPVKQIESALDKGVTDSGPVIGTHVAKTHAFMPVFASTLPSADASLPAQAEVASAEATRWNPSAEADQSAAVEVPALAARAVEAVLGVADRVATGQRSAVRLEFEVGGTELSVRVALRDHAVHAIFQTESPELRAALVHEWQAMSAEPTERPIPFAAPVFQAGSSDASNQGALAGDFSRHSRDGQSRRSNDSEFNGWTGHASNADTRGTGAAVAAPGHADHLPHSVHLHTLA